MCARVVEVMPQRSPENLLGEKEGRVSWRDALVYNPWQEFTRKVPNVVTHSTVSGLHTCRSRLDSFESGWANGRRSMANTQSWQLPFSSSWPAGCDQQAGELKIEHRRRRTLGLRVVEREATKTNARGPAGVHTR